MGRLGDQLLDFSTSNTQPVNQETCENGNGSIYTCNVGHCCGEEGCCTYYYELWWFWLIWGLVIFMTCCCIYHHRQKRRDARRLRNNAHSITGREPFAGACNYPGPPLDNKVLGYCKLPLYDDVIRIPPSASPPPPYSSRRRPVNTIACVQQNENGDTAMTIVPCNITSSMLSLASLSYYIPKVLAQNHLSPLNNNVATDNRQSLHHTTAMTNNTVDTPSIIPCCTTSSSTNQLTCDDKQQESVLMQEIEVKKGCSSKSLTNEANERLSDDSYSDDEEMYTGDVDLNNNVAEAFLHPKSSPEVDQIEEDVPTS